MPDPPTQTLIDDLLENQRALTAVERFSDAHDRGGIRAARYRDLLPSGRLTPGKQLAFEVDLDKCTGCKACVTACHALNGLDEGEAWREVGTLVSEDWRRPFQQVVTTACHHCVDPGCLRGCPVLAYEKDSVTGIVRHLDDQCIGCQYCVLMCPYDVPKYSEARGIVRKCDLCAQRLDVGEAPACVQACPNEAIRITIVDQEELRTKFNSRGTQPRAGQSNLQPPTSNLGAIALPLTGSSRVNLFLPASPDPSLTVPTTLYVSKRALAPDLVPVEVHPERLQPAHWPLAWMLVLTQGAVGVFALSSAMPMAERRALATAAFCAALAGVLASVAHLGRPSRAWRSFLGVRRSWLSREILAFGGFLGLAAWAAGAMWLGGSGRGPSSVPAPSPDVLFWVTVGIGLVGVCCSGMVYHATGRVAWRGTRSLGRFFGTTAVLGFAVAWAVAVAMSMESRAPWFALGLVLATILKLAGEHRLFRLADGEWAEDAWPRDGDFDAWSLRRSAGLMRDRFGVVTRLRFAGGWMGGVVLPMAGLLWPQGGALLAGAGVVLCFGGELAERFLFFRVVIPPRMPGS